MNDEIKFLYNKRKVLITTQVLEKIKYLTRKDDVFSIKKKTLANEMDSGEFYEIIENIISRSKNTVKYLPNKDNRINYDTRLIYLLAQKYNELYPEEKRIYDSFDDEILDELLNVIYQIEIEVKNFYLMCNLIDAKKDCTENMKYFLDDVTIAKFNDEYEKAIQSKDIKKMSDMLNYIQQAILKEWKRYFSNIDAMNDDNFCFIGHSTNSLKFNGDFCSRYVSTSLFNQDLTDTYKSGYGFIFAPKNIVGANSKDMYVNNYVEDEDNMLHYSSIKKIDHPQRLIDECIKLKSENIKNGESQKVYSEVIIDGFEPIGIFCFTDGSKNLNWNFKCAQQLQESFPHLKIYSFDIMKRKKGTELDEMKLSLLNSLKNKFTNHKFDISMDMLPRYDYFFEEYEKLKQKEEYTEDEIATIFKNNDNLLSVFNSNPEDLFNGMYNEKQIKYILGKNVTYNIDYILSGNARAFALNNLKKLYPYKDKLNSMYAGLNEFLELLSRMEITDEMMLEINDKDSIDFYTISKVLASKLIDSLNSREEQGKQNLNDYQIKYNELQKEIRERTIIQEQYDYYNSIYSNRFYAEMIKKDYKNIINDINIAGQKETELQTELEKTESALSEIQEKIKSLENFEYDDSREHVYCKNAIEEIKKYIYELSKHPFINRKRIKEEKNKLKVLEEKNLIGQVNFESLKTEESNNLESKKIELQSKKDKLEQNLNFIQSDKKQLDEQLATLKSKIKNYFKCESIDEIDLSISKAEDFMKKYDNFNQSCLIQLNCQLEKLANSIINQQTNLNDIQEEKEIISRNM